MTLRKHIRSAQDLFDFIEEAREHGVELVCVPRSYGFWVRSYEGVEVTFPIGDDLYLDEKYGVDTAPHVFLSKEDEAELRELLDVDKLLEEELLRLGELFVKLYCQKVQEVDFVVDPELSTRWDVYLEDSSTGDSRQVIVTRLVWAARLLLKGITSPSVQIFN